MSPNSATPERIVRLVAALVLPALPFVSGWAFLESALWTWRSAIVGLVLAVADILVLAVAGILRFCPTRCMMGCATNAKACRR